MERYYLEKATKSSTRFCEMEREGTSCWIYTGQLGTLGRCERNTKQSEEEARERLSQYLEDFQAKGYVLQETIPPLPLATPEPESLPGQPLTESQLAHFTRTLIEHPTEMQRLFWEREMATFMRERVYDGAARLSYVGSPRTLAQEFETIAAWDSPAMQREVERNDRGMVIELRYYINGLQVLTLSNRNTGLPIRPFFCPPENKGFTYGRKRTLLQEVRTLLTHFPAFCAEYITRVEELADQKTKERKVVAVASVGIEAMVDGLMAGTGHLYRLTPQGKGSQLQVRISPARYVEMNLPHKTFRKRMDDVLPTVETLTRLVEELPMDFGLGAGSTDYEWGTVDRHELFYQGNDARSEFWREAFTDYIARTFQPSPSDGPPAETLEVETIAQWDIPGLEREVEASRGKVHTISYAIDGRRVLMLHAGGYHFPLTSGGKRMQSIPPLAQWHGFLEGFPAFYEQTEAAFGNRFPDAHRAAAVRELMERLGYQWHLNLSHRQMADLIVLMPKKRVLTLNLEADRFEELLAQVPETIAKIERVMREIKHAFRVEIDLHGAGWKRG
ncbi:MAG: hypothetical protein CSA97_02090 [Bacteroidetes bacterium]|nr:MAG: hypothetical protein CSA97_02090 [Bacteroidota bacterium]